MFKEALTPSRVKYKVLSRCNKVEVMSMLFEDKDGNIWLPEEIDELAAWEIEEKGLHIFEVY